MAFTRLETVSCLNAESKKTALHTRNISSQCPVCPKWSYRSDSTLFGRCHPYAQFPDPKATSGLPQRCFLDSIPLATTLALLRQRHKSGRKAYCTMAPTAHVAKIITRPFGKLLSDPSFSRFNAADSTDVRTLSLAVRSLVI